MKVFPHIHVEFLSRYSDIQQQKNMCPEDTNRSHGFGSDVRRFEEFPQNQNHQGW